MKRFCCIFNDREHARRFLCGLIIAALALMVREEFWQPVSAQSIIGYSDFSCSNGQANGNLFSADIMSASVNSYDGNAANMTTYNIDATAPVYSNNALNLADPTVNSTTGSPGGPGGPSGPGPGTAGQCSAEVAPDMGMFARLLCFFRSTLGQIMSSMYCGFQNVMQGPIMAAMTLFIVIYGIFVTTGMVHVNVKEVMKVFFKMILVLLFTTHAEWGIGVGYHFFMTVAESGSSMVLSAMNSATNGNASLTQPDALFYSLFGMAEHGNGLGANAGNVFLSALNISSFCATAIIPLLLLMLPAALPVTIFIVIMLLMYIGLYARAVLGYLTALVLITFLFVLSPIFICFALFGATEKIFERWLQYLISYSIQMIIVFAFLAMIQLVPVGTFFTNLLSLMKEYDTTFRVFFLTIPIHTCGVCDLNLTDYSGVNLLSTSNPPTCTPLASATSPLPNTGDLVSRPDVAPATTVGAVYPVIPLLNLLQHQDFVSFMMAEIIALWLVGYVMNDFLKKAPDIAKEIGSMPMALKLGGASAAPQQIGDFMTSISYPGTESIEAAYHGFKKEFTKDPLSLTAWPRRISGGMMGAVQGLMRGAVDTDNPEAMDLDKQAQDINNYVTDTQRRYATAQRTTQANYTSMMRQQTPQAAQALSDYDKLKADRASDSDIKAAYARLNPTQQNYVLARDNETQCKQDLDNAKVRQNDINNRLSGMMYHGLADVETPDGVSRGTSSLMRFYDDQRGIYKDKYKKDDDDDDS